MKGLGAAYYDLVLDGLLCPVMTVMRMVWCYDADMDCCMYVRTLLEFCYRWLNVCDVDGYIYG